MNNNDFEAGPPQCTLDAIAKGMCDGDCEHHTGEVRPVHVQGWGWFAYCDAAVAEDQRRGLTTKDGK